MKIKRIALVEAASAATNVYSSTYLPRVGIPTLGAIVKKLGYECDIWFQAMPGFDANKLSQYDVVGIGSISNTIPEAYRIADSLKGKGPIVVMGGPHPTFLPEEALNHSDYVVIGEGDETFPKLLKALEDEKPPRDVPGLAYRESGDDLVFTDAAPRVNFENLPIPDFKLSPQVDPANIPPIISTSRGCPHNCSFCSVTPVFGRKYRFKTNEQVIAELRPLKHRSICFGDDNFCSNAEHTKKLLRDIIAADAAPLRWSAQMCVAAASDLELLSLMEQTNCRIIYVGIESVNIETLKKFGKVHNVEAVKECVDNLHKYNIGIHGMFVLDINDPPETAKDIVDYAIATEIDTIQIFSITPFPGTRAHEEYRDEILHRDWKYYDGMHVVVKPKKCSAYEAQMSIINQMLRFYSLKRVIGGYRKGRGWRVKYRFGGHYLMKKWLKENADYLEKLKTGFYA